MARPALESADDLGDFFDVLDFSIAATITRADGVILNVIGVFEAPEASRNITAMTDVITPAPTFLCPSADAEGVAEGDAFASDEGNYTVRGVIKDGTGITSLVLEDTT